MRTCKSCRTDKLQRGLNKLVANGAFRSEIKWFSWQLVNVESESATKSTVKKGISLVEVVGTIEECIILLIEDVQKLALYLQIARGLDRQFHMNIMECLQGEIIKVMGFG